MDYGFPQILDPEVLKLYITQGKMAAALSVSINSKDFSIGCESYPTNYHSSYWSN
jgi:hypothetical protein